MEEKSKELISKFGAAPLEVRAKVQAISYFHTKLSSMDADLTIEEQIAFLKDYWKTNGIESLKEGSIEEYMQDFLNSISTELVEANKEIFEQDKSPKENFAQIILLNAANLLFDSMKNQEFKDKAITEYYTYLNNYISSVSLYILEHDRFDLTRQDSTKFMEFAELLKKTNSIAGNYTVGQSIGVSQKLMEEVFPKLAELKGQIEQDFMDQIIIPFVSIFVLYVSQFVAKGPIAQLYVEGMNDDKTRRMYLNNISKFEEEVGCSNEKMQELLSMAKLRLEKSFEQASSSGCLGIVVLFVISSLASIGLISCTLL